MVTEIRDCRFITIPIITGYNIVIKMRITMLQTEVKMQTDLHVNFQEVQEMYSINAMETIIQMTDGIYIDNPTQ